jgi:hypothetical protein
MPIIKGLVIKDLHFGHKRSEEMYHELQIVKDYLNNNHVDILNINGDYFDRKLVATEPAIFFAVTFFSELVEICRRKNIKIRIIQGTRSHELNQLTTMFQHYLSDATVDIKIFFEVAEEELFGLKFLYVPEEYLENSEAYYAPYKTNHYNVIHGHGTWDFVHFAIMLNEEETQEKSTNGALSAPVFVYEEWKETIKDGLAIFGHIHKRQNHNNVFYGGSFTAWGYGDRSEKGFTVYSVDNETNKWTIEHHNNEKAPRYDVTSVKDLFKGKDLKTISIEEIQKIINEQVEKTDNLRVDLAGLSEDKIQIFKSAFKDNDKVKIEVKKKKALLKESTEPAIYDQFGYILNRELPIDETIKRFVSEEYATDLTLEKIKEILT